MYIYIYPVFLCSPNTATKNLKKQKRYRSDLGSQNKGFPNLIKMVDFSTHKIHVYIYMHLHVNDV